MMDTIIPALRDMLASSCGSRAKTYFAGNIGLPQKSMLPCVIVKKRETKAERPGTARDQYKFGVSILVITDVVTSFNEAGLQNRIVASDLALSKLMEETDTTTKGPKTDTILGCLMRQQNIHGADFLYNLNPRVNYNPPSPEGFFYVAAEVTLDILTDVVQRSA